MRHARADYARIQAPADMGIPADEPVFLLRAQDILAARTVKYWAHLARDHGADATIVDAAIRQAEAMHVWPVHQVPDMPADADVSRETLTAAQRAFQATLMGVVLDYASYLTGAGAARFGRDVGMQMHDGPFDMAHGLVEGATAWAAARGIDPGHATMDWRKLIPAAAGTALDR